MKTVKINNTQKGFTLIELLIVIAVLGVLAAVVMVAINPLEQLARGRDSGRKTGVGQLASATQAYYTSHSAVYPNASTAWIDELVTAGELKSPPAPISYAAGGAGAVACAAALSQNNYCYYTHTSGAEAVVFTALESTSEDSKCPSASNKAFFVWSSVNGQSGLYCADAEPTVTDTSFTFVANN